jgi:hypothetical protein
VVRCFVVCVCVFEASDYPIWKRHSIFLSFFCSRSAQMGVSLDISFRVTDESHRIGVSNHMTQYHPTAFEDLFIRHMFQRLVNTMYGQTGQAAKVLHVNKGFKPNISPLLVICLGRHVDLTRL